MKKLEHIDERLGMGDESGPRGLIEARMGGGENSFVVTLDSPSIPIDQSVDVCPVDAPDGTGWFNDGVKVTFEQRFRL